MNTKKTLKKNAPPKKSPVKKKVLNKTTAKGTPILGCGLIEEELNERTERYESLFNSIDDGFSI